MSDTKFTPGPWSVYRSKNPLAKRHGIDALNGSLSIIVFGIEGEDEGIHGSDDAEVEANANLIAAAPELYEALERMLDEFGQSAIQDMTITSVLSQAEHTLAKARGETE